MRTSFYDYCRQHDQAPLLAQWDAEKNAPLTPQTVTYGSRIKCWWRCEKGHAYQSAVYSRTAGTGCPYCSGARPCAGENDLATLRPDLARQWHPVKNGARTPDTLSVGSHSRVWWLCEKGHAWQAAVKSRASGSGCPVCANRRLIAGENDLASTHPALARQWHPEKNGALTPRSVSAGARRKVWWRCEKGHAWQAAVVSRASGGAGCPVCAGKLVIAGENDLASIFPDIAAEWHPEKNGTLRPQQLTPYSNRRVWWRCEKGHAYQACVGARSLSGSGCPYCAGRKVLPGFNDLATAQPKIAAQWHPTRNGALTAQMVTVGSHRKIWWQCAEGHVWKAVVYSRACAKCGCPVCAGTAGRRRPRIGRTSMEETRFGGSEGRTASTKI